MKGKVRFWPEELNNMGFEQRKEHKERLMRESIKYMYDNSPEYYQVCFKECGAEPGDIKTIEDLRKLPIFMDKDRERQSMETSLEKYGHPFGLHVCCDPADIISTGGTAGTTGHPTYPYSQTQEDFDLAAEAVAFMHNEILGLGRGDRAFFLFPLGVYATSTLLPGIQKAGILPLPIEIRLGPQVAMELVKWTKPTFWWTGAAIVDFYLEGLKKMGIDPKDFGFKCIILTGEIGCGIPELKKKVEEGYGCRWYDFWGPSFTSISISCDSDEYYGLHNFAADIDICYEDLVDPETKEPIELKEGAVGEIIVTHLRKKASPYLKYATGDVVELFTSECPACGFKGYRIKPVGRSDDMLTVKGVNVFGGAILRTLQKLVPKVTGHMRIIKEDPSHRITKLKLRVEYAAGMEDKLDDLANEIRQVMKTELRVSPEIEWTAPESLDRPARKPPLFEKRY
ncbi:MAG: phenylacetate--CoA ligase family protein [Deltaproteobacteria bacterium]|nr:phenylacetate--CoA ligase family protein [Deltaproteobacteria bacterium]